MISKRGVERLAGALLVSIFVAFLVSIVTFVDVDVDREDIRESLQEVDDDLALYVTSWAFNLAGGLLLVVASGVLYLVFRAHERVLALLGLVAFLGAGLAFAVSTMSFFGLAVLAEDFIEIAGPSTEAMVSSARALGVFGFSAWTTAVTLLGAGLLSIGALIVGKRAMPCWLGIWGIISGVLLLVSWVIVAPSIAGFIIVAIASISGLLWMLVMGSLLIVQGPREAPAS